MLVLGSETSNKDSARPFGLQRSKCSSLYEIKVSRFDSLLLLLSLFLSGSVIQEAFDPKGVPLLVSVEEDLGGVISSVSSVHGVV